MAHLVVELVRPSQLGQGYCTVDMIAPGDNGVVGRHDGLLFVSINSTKSHNWKKATTENLAEATILLTSYKENMRIARTVSSLFDITGSFRSSLSFLRARP